MFDRLVNSFKKSDLDEQRAFQNRVVRILREQQPDKNITATAEPQTVDIDGKTCGLTNIRSTFLLTTQTDDDLRTVLAEFMAALNSGIAEKTDISLDEARPKILPQLMPREFLQKMPLVNLEFGDEIVLGFVIDDERAYQYINDDALLTWGIDAEELKTIALENLAIRTTGVEVTAIPSPNGFVVINTMDSFDAVRVLLPKIKDFVGDIIGKPFYFGVPNRDFLVCWEKNEDEEFHSRFKAQIATDFDERPYPLSGKVFEVTPENEISLVPGDTTSGRETNAHLN